MTMQSSVIPIIALSPISKGNGYQATVTLPDGVSMSSAETYPSIAEAITAAAMKLLNMPERLKALDTPQSTLPANS